jgi:phosphoribosylformimino-5-aminoimidazole carboxamide ribotide isomerase
MEVIPALDLLGGRCVRLYQGDFNQVTVYDENPVDLARRYRDAGMHRLHVVDLDGARSGEPGNLDLIAELTGDLGLAVQIGGGLRDLERVRTLLDTGASRVVIGSAAVTDPQMVIGWINELGAERVIPAFDVKLNQQGEPVVQTHGWTKNSEQTLWELMDCYAGTGAMDFLCTDISKDGTLAGPNVELYASCTERYPQARIIASGGVAGFDDLIALKRTGASAVVTGKALLDSRLQLEEIQRFLQNA